MAAYSQIEIDSLLLCPKEIWAAPKRGMRLTGAHYRNDAILIASDREIKGEFVVFMRKE